ncbi:DUF1538 domain-containing protein [Papillibacter cinnamivorans]|uniref:DUF1538 domain-containing protein n=1 Tax=Papillibacter cinnamivorans DSM 12816 TaxID=1122930 RepID=A0A1W2CUB7_9FIRM|nr:DUF1538 domain-containing protein [Papillibacter cinnamivorans]SMC88813.1 Protein of unknown function [Papillibacter cinnamivorans DSM 12816]
MNILAEKGKEVLVSVLPVTGLVLLLHATLAPLDLPVLFRFLIGAVLVTAGLSVFLVGVDLGITPIGTSMGASIAKSNRVSVVLLSGLVLGFVVSVAEPDLHILAGQVAAVTSGAVSKAALVAAVSAGIAVLLAAGLVRIVYNVPLYKILAGLYGGILILSLFVSREFLAVSFDASGATTGALTVPFILALALGVSAMKKDSKASEKDSFGLVAVASAGAVISVMLMSLFFAPASAAEVSAGAGEASSSVLGPFLHEFPAAAWEIFVALLPVALLFLVLQPLALRLSRRMVRRIVTGILFAFAGLVLFLAGVNAGFMTVGSQVGYTVASLENKTWLVAVGFVLGVFTILAEPAVHVLTRQIEDVTSGYVKRSLVMLTLSLGVGAAVALSMVRILVPGIQLWHYLLPGYVLSVALSFFTPKLFVGIAFDSGGVASGPMTATFILAFSQGAAHASEGASVLAEGFGMIAMVAMTPIVALQLLGLVYRVKSRKEDLADG